MLALRYVPCHLRHGMSLSRSREFVVVIRLSGKGVGYNFVERVVVLLKMRCVCVALLSLANIRITLGHAGQTSEFNRDLLQPLTKYRQQHRRTVDGRLCAAAFVQNRKAYTGCTDASNPIGESGRPWCYVEPQVIFCFGLDFYVCWQAGCLLQLLDAGSPPWNYCGCCCRCALTA